MGNVGLEIRGQVDDIDGSKWALLRADTASNAEGFRDECNLGFWSDFNAQATTSNNRTRFLALLSTFLWLALVSTDNSNTGELVGHFCRFCEAGVGENEIL